MKPRTVDSSAIPMAGNAGPWEPPRPEPTPGTLRDSAFTLIEIVLSLGIIAFALVGIMGMLPVALNTARESAQESQATLIAQRIFAEIRASEDGPATLSVGPSTTAALNLDSDDEVFLLFGSDDPTKPVAPIQTVTAGQFQTGFNSTAAQFLVKVETITAANLPTQVNVIIEAPAAATDETRARIGRYPFVTLVAP